ncbi:ribonuclease J [Candidatus Endowatersipora endosymbiont of Watersipora subatra]|uniref:ribonuclease J n=1 Tax=Candidatus Endowatersipora endosymbiont of Watersipora subatra TaxID=3077946 RepID=UPI00312CB78E
MIKKNKDELFFLPLGGVGEIGMNLALYGYGSRKKCRWIIVDVGITFPNNNFPGTDLVVPDIAFVLERIEQLDGIIITHAHEDHYGALFTLWPKLRVPVHCTPFAAKMLEAKRLSELNAPNIPLKIFKTEEPFSIGSFTVEGVHVNHSIPEPVSLMIRSPLGNIIHTGDWKIDRKPTIGHLTNEAYFRCLGNEGILALVCDSTNAMQEGISASEEEVLESLIDIIDHAPGRVIVTTFSSNVGRIRSVALAAEKVGRRVMIIGRSLLRVVDVSRDLGYLDGVAPFLDENEFQSVPRKKLVVICTGSQGESQAALGKMARDDHRNARLVPGDQVIFSSRSIPGNEKGILSIQNALVDKGVTIVLDEEKLVHVSGHPRRDELSQMYEWTRPTIGVPVHGEARHLMAHANLMEVIGIPNVAVVRNGDMLRLAPGPTKIIDKVVHGRAYKDGRLIGDQSSMGIDRRRILSCVGHVVMSLVVNKDGYLLAEPKIVCEGLPKIVDGEDNFKDLLYDVAVSAFERIPLPKRRDHARIKQVLRKALRNEVVEVWGKKSIVTIFVTTV